MQFCIHHDLRNFKAVTQVFCNIVGRMSLQMQAVACAIDKGEWTIIGSSLIQLLVNRTPSKDLATSRSPHNCLRNTVRIQLTMNPGPTAPKLRSSLMFDTGINVPHQHHEAAIALQS